jgi:hypothetical protein
MNCKLLQGLTFGLVAAFALSAAVVAQTKIAPGQLSVRAWAGKPRLTWTQIQALKTAKTGHIPLWTYGLVAARDGKQYQGVMVGDDPTNPNSGQQDVPTPVVPAVYIFNVIATGINEDGSFQTKPGITVFDPTVADDACMAAPNDVPITVALQSPVFTATDVYFGGTFIGHTQFVDAFQRANFWQKIDQTKYHVVLNPVTQQQAIVLNIPPASGVAIPPDLFQNPPCGPLGILDINLLDNTIQRSILPQLYQQGIDQTTFPNFVQYNTVMSIGPPNIHTCCALGYHNEALFLNTLTFSVADFNMLGIFGPELMDSAILSHEVAEWMDDPFTWNLTPAWGHIGQVQGCQNNLEVGDPLTGTVAYLVTNNNTGFQYHEQELAFFSWFFGGPSIGLNGWFSNAGTFLTDAGPVCH